MFIGHFLQLFPDKQKQLFKYRTNYTLFIELCGVTSAWTQWSQLIIDSKSNLCWCVQIWRYHWSTCFSLHSGWIGYLRKIYTDTKQKSMKITQNSLGENMWPANICRCQIMQINNPLRFMGICKAHLIIISPHICTTPICPFLFTYSNINYSQSHHRDHRLSPWKPRHVAILKRSSRTNASVKVSILAAIHFSCINTFEHEFCCLILNVPFNQLPNN